MCVCVWENGSIGASVCALLFVLVAVDAVAAAAIAADANAAADAAATSFSSFFVGDLQRF